MTRLLRSQGRTAGIAATLAALSVSFLQRSAATDIVVIAMVLTTLGISLLRVNVRSDVDVPGITIDVLDVLSVAFALSCVWWMVSVSGVPAFRQDWHYSPIGAEFSREVTDGFSGWRTDGLGSAQPQAGIFPVYVIIAFAAKLFNTQAGIVLFLVGILGATLIVTRRAIARLTGADPVVAWICALPYALGPIALNRLVAGHLMHLYFAAALPAAVLLTALRLDEPRSSKRTSYDIVLVLLIASTGHLPPTMLLLLAVVGTLFIAEGRLVGACAIAGGALLLNLPTAIAVRLVPGTIYYAKQAVTQWQFAQSAPPSLLLHLGGYLARYSDQMGWHWAQVACAASVALLPLGAALAHRRAAVVILLAALAGLATMGLYGPLAPVLEPAFVAFPALSLFRELYDIAPVFAFGAAIAAAGVLNSCVARAPRLRVPALLACAAVALLAVAPTVVDAERELVPIVDASAAAHVVAALPGTGRVLWLPGIYPMQTGAGRGEGYDPLMVRHGDHEAIAAFQPEGAVARAYWLLEKNPERARAWLQNLGCDWIAVDRNALPAGSIDAPSYARMLSGVKRIGRPFRQAGHLIDVFRLEPGAPLVQAADVAQRSGPVVEPGRSTDVSLMIDDPVNRAAVLPLGPAPPAWTLFAPSKRTADPHLGFVLGSNNWRSAAAYGDLPGASAVVTFDRAVQVRAGSLVARQSGEEWSRASYQYLNAPKTVRFRGWTAALGVRTGRATNGRVLARSTAAVAYERRDRTHYTIRAVRGALQAIVFRETYDDGWRLAAAGSRPPIHFRADGWANGWLVRMNAGESARITFAPDNVLIPAETIGAILWVALTLAAFASAMRRVTHLRGR